MVYTKYIEYRQIPLAESTAECVIPGIRVEGGAACAAAAAAAKKIHKGDSTMTTYLLEVETCVSLAIVVRLTLVFRTCY